MSYYKRDYFEEMNIDYEELKDYVSIETYYNEIRDFSDLIQELQCDRVESQKYIVRANNEIERLNNIINELESYLEQQYLEWKDCETDVKFMAHEDKAILDKLKELKEGK